MKYLLLCYSKCTTCQEAKRFLDEKGIQYNERPIKEQNPTKEELTGWWKKSGLPLKKFFNTSGLLYKSMGLANKLPGMSENEMLTILSSDGMLVKRPIITDGQLVLVGYKKAEWETLK